MACWRLDDRKQAGECYARGVRWLEDNEARLRKEGRLEEVSRFRAEAAALLRNGPEGKPDQPK